MSPVPLQLVWLRNDLRCSDHAAFAGASAAGPVVAVYCLCPEQWQAHDVGGNRADFTLRSLKALAADLEARNIPLRLLDAERFERVPAALLALARELGVAQLWFVDEYPLNEQRRDARVQAVFEEADIGVVRCTDRVLQAPGTVLTGKGEPYTVFTPFKRRWLARLDPGAVRPRGAPEIQAPLAIAADPVPAHLPGFEAGADPETWPAGEAEARRRLDAFLAGGVDGYDAQRDRPAVDGTSRLSPYLAIGALGPRTCLDALLAHGEGRLPEAEQGRKGPATWLSELIWREFYQHVVAAFPHVSRGRAFRERYDAVPWRHDPESLGAWQAGRTGIPIVDAGMRQLVAEGWMHNRVRMITAMFLTKNLLIDWREGERFFMKHLIDGDFAANNGGWQWSASTGTDAAPYFRVFNPVTQGERFDPDGAYVRRWLPELAGVPPKAIHAPHLHGGAPDYPQPIVDLKASRLRAIEAFRGLQP